MAKWRTYIVSYCLKKKKERKREKRGAHNAIPVALGCGVALVTQGVCYRSHMVQMDRINFPQKQYGPLPPLHIFFLCSTSFCTFSKLSVHHHITWERNQIHCLTSLFIPFLSTFSPSATLSHPHFPSTLILSFKHFPFLSFLLYLLPPSPHHTIALTTKCTFSGNDQIYSSSVTFILFSIFSVSCFLSSFFFLCFFNWMSLIFKCVGLVC